jgi:hypothetical protein
MQRIEDVIGKTKSADRISEDPWFRIVMKEINEISRDCAGELQQETGAIWNKGSYALDLKEAPPARILALQIALASWLGWIMREKHGDSGQTFSAEDCLKRIITAYEFGVDLSRKGQRP